MANHFIHLKSLVKKLGIAFLMFTICRIVFYFFYINEFSDVNIGVFFYGIRFDLVAISFLFAPLILFQLFPIPFRSKNFYQKIVNTLFYIGICIGITLNMLDIGYFQYTLKRTTADLFGMVSTGNDFFTLLPHYIIDFWYAYVICGILIYLSVLFYKKWAKLTLSFVAYNSKSYLIHSIIFLFTISLLILGMRGGTQYRPLSIVSAAKYSDTQNIPVVLNTPFTIIKTLFEDRIEFKTYFTEKKLASLYTPEQTIIGTGEFENKNVVLIILESFGKEYVGYLNNNKGYTPFLDSLLKESYVYTNAYANGQRSMESLPSILAGLPQLMGPSYIVSNYSSNELDGLPKILKAKGYNTSFYHGGENGTMSFNSFTKVVGIENYYGLNEYPENLKEKDYDGLWGVFDEPYLQYYANELKNKKQPFFSSVFTLSSHHPYTIPKKHKNKFPKGNLAIHESIGYTDYSLQQFFKVAHKMDWFNNTIFVFTADHASISKSPLYKNKLNRLAIPIFIYDPSGNLKGENKDYFQQIDITPTIVSKLNIKTSIINFGNNSFKTNSKYAINYMGGNYQMAFSDYFIVFDGEITTGLYNTKTDSLLSNNLITKLTSKETAIKTKAENKIKAIIQQYNNRLINNNLSHSN